MSDESHADTLATAVANVNNILRSVDYLVQRSDASAVQHTEVISKLAVIVSKQDDSKNYQDKCDAERKDFDKRISAAEIASVDLVRRLAIIESQNLDRRVTATETFQNAQLKVVGVLATIISLIVTGAIEWMRK